MQKKTKDIITLALAALILVGMNTVLSAAAENGTVPPFRNIMLWNGYSAFCIATFLWSSALLGIPALVMAGAYILSGWAGYPSGESADTIAAGAAHGTIMALIILGIFSRNRDSFFSKGQIPFIVIALLLLEINALLFSRIWTWELKNMLQPIAAPLMTGLVTGTLWIMIQCLRKKSKASEKTKKRAPELKIPGTPATLNTSSTPALQTPAPRIEFRSVEEDNDEEESEVHEETSPLPTLITPATNPIPATAELQPQKIDVPDSTGEEKNPPMTEEIPQIELNEPKEEEIETTNNGLAEKEIKTSSQDLETETEALISNSPSQAEQTTSLWAQRGMHRFQIAAEPEEDLEDEISNEHPNPIDSRFKLTGTLLPAEPDEDDDSGEKLNPWV